MYDVTAVCRAYVDLIVPVTFEELKALGLIPGQDQLVSKEEISRLTTKFLDRAEIWPGGPGANTVSGVRALSGKSAFIGKVSDDQLGRIFKEDMEGRDIDFDTEVLPNDVTASCVIFVVPSGDRTILYNPTIADKVTMVDLEANKAVLETTKILFLGWLNRETKCADVIKRIYELTPNAKYVASLQSYGARENDEFDAISKADILLGNENEYGLYIMDLKLDDIAELSLAMPEKTFVCTKGKHGASVYQKGICIDIAAAPCEKVIDATGGGDAWAAGFLYGMAQDMPIEKCGALGALCAAEIIQHNGARPQGSWTHLLEQVK